MRIEELVPSASIPTSKTLSEIAELLDAELLSVTAVSIKFGKTSFENALP